MGSGYIFCEADQLPVPQTCSLSNAGVTFLGIGGTSASAPAFAGIMALVNQFTNSSGQGNANYVLYKLASSSAQTSQNCGATSSPSTSGCIFYDVTSGTIAVPCAKGSTPDCTTTNPADTYGVLNGYNAGPGYDLATGIGSVNASNLVHNWIGPSTASTTTLTLTPPSGGSLSSLTHGQSVNVSIGVTPSAATGVVSLVGLPGGTGTAAVPMASFPLQQNGTASGTAVLAGGQSYQVHAHYSGNGTYTPSDSLPVTVTVATEPSTTLITVPVFDPNTGAETGNTPTSIVYGTTTFAVRVDVGNGTAKTTFPEQLVCAPLTCPTGTVTLSDTFNGGAPTLLSPSGGFPLSSGGYALDYNVPLLSGGTHQFSASYPGDNSYENSAGSYALSVTPALTKMSGPFGFINLPAIVGTSVQVSETAMATSPFSGAAPTGTITFYDGGVPIAGTVTYSAVPGSTGGFAMLTGTITTTFTSSGTHQISAKYSGDANYAGATDPGNGISIVFATSAVEVASPLTINLGQSVNITATVTGASKTPAMTGTFQFQGLTNPVAGMVGTDTSGNQTLTATATVSPQFTGSIFVSYSGDSNYAFASSSAFVTVNLPDFSMGTSAPGLTITAGQSASTQLTLTPLNNIASSVTLTCNNPIAGSTCSFNPPSPLSLSNGAAASTTVSITTLPPSSSPTTSLVGIRPPSFRPILPSGFWMIALANALALLLTLIFAGQSRRQTAARIGLVGFLGLVLGCSGGNGGGGGGNPPPPTPTSLTLSTSAVKVAFGANVTFTVSVSSSNMPTGIVALLDSGGGLTSTNVANGTATFQVNSLLIGTHMISAQYGGDSRNLSSSTKGSISEVITGTTPISVVASSPQISHTAQINVTIQ